jgi:putative ABC transport system permease protein
MPAPIRPLATGARPQGSVWPVRLTAQWRKAPFVLVYHRSVLLAVFSAALLAALASASAPFVTTAAASEALKNKLAELTSFATGVKIEGSRQLVGVETPAGFARHRAATQIAAAQLRTRFGHVGPPVFTTQTGLPVGASGHAGGTSVVLMTRTDALRHVRVLREVAGRGVFVSDITAHAAGVKPGGTLRIEPLAPFVRPKGSSVRVKGIYRALAHSPVTDYWSGLYHEIYPRCLDCGVPPSFLFLAPNALDRLLAGSHGAVTNSVEFPIDPRGLTLVRARELDRKFASLRHDLRNSSLGQKLGCTSAFRVGKCYVISSLSAAVILADRNAGAVTPAVTLLSDLGTAIALAVAAAAGLFLVRRRRAEAGLAYVHGEHVGTFAARSAIEVLIPTVAGGAAGFALAYGLTDVFAQGSIASGTVWSAVVHALVAVTVGLCLLALVASVAFLRLYDTGSHSVRWARWLPWEAFVGGAAIVLFVRIRSGGAVSSGAAHTPTLEVFVYPLLLVAAVGGIASRSVRMLLRRSSGHARHSRPAIYLALRRLAAGRGLVVALSLVAAVSFGSLFYVETLGASLKHTTIEKAYMATGSDANAIVGEDEALPRTSSYAFSRVQFSNQSASLPDGTTVDVMLVDPATLVRTLHWQGNWGPNPARVLRQLDQARSQPLPVIVTTDLASAHSIVISGRRFGIDTLGTVRVFPFMAEGIPLVITSFRALHDLESRTKLYQSLGVLQTYVWGKGPPLEVAHALSSLQPVYPPQSTDTFLHDPDVVLATRTFGFMRLIAIGAGVLALLGMLLYLQARQRSQEIASVLARRMGFGRLAETLSLTLEVCGILAFAALLGGGVAIAAAAPVVHRIDPLPQDPPSPLFTVPLTVIAVVGGALLVFALVAGALTSWLARRTDLAETLRVA